MSAFFSSIGFVHPLVLAGLIGIPLLWYILRVTPPAPKRIIFAPLRFLKDLVPEKVSPSHTPWWLLLLRCLIVALVILAFAQPVLNPSDPMKGQTNIRLVIDTGWASAQNWSQITQTAHSLIASADRENKSITLLTTTRTANQPGIVYEGPMGASDAKALLDSLSPHPWPSDFALVLKAVEDTSRTTQTSSVYSYMLSSGIADKRFSDLMSLLQNQGGVSVYEPVPNKTPILLTTITNGNDGTLEITTKRAHDKQDNQPITLHAIGANGQIIDYISASVESAENKLSFPLPDSARNDISQIRLAGSRHAGGVILFDENDKRRKVGIVSSTEGENPKPLTDALYFLDRALQPYAEMVTGSLDDVLDGEPSLLIMPDIGVLPTAQLERLEKWIRNGGSILRFAGPVMSASPQTFLTPVPLLQGTRALDGQVTWEEPQIIAPIPDTSPLFGLEMIEPITVRQQILAEPISDMDDQVWATLEDGTPIITGSRLEGGRLIMVHTTATPDWSDLALSGLYVGLLRRIIAMSQMPVSDTAITATSLTPVSVMDGFGQLKPAQDSLPIDATSFQTVEAGPDHPPGLYSDGTILKALNLGERLASLQTIGPLPLSFDRQTYGETYEQDLMPILLTLAFILLLVDALIILFIQGGMTTFSQHGLRLNRKIRAKKTQMNSLILIASLISACLFSVSASAQNTTFTQNNNNSNDSEFAGTIYLAYVKGPNEAVNSTSEKGLQALSRVLSQRTSVEPKDVVGINPERDDLSFYPFLYWPVSEQSQTISDEGLQNIQHYLNHGGTILFDTRDYNQTAGTSGINAITPATRILRAMIGRLNVPPLMRADDDHVLRKTFYLLDHFPGRYADGPVWVEQQSSNGRDGVSSILIGGNDWAAAWAAEQRGGSLRPYLNGGPRQQEIAFRFGVNMMMYALTGNYKADQVHVPFILERLGQ